MIENLVRKKTFEGTFSVIELSVFVFIQTTGYRIYTVSREPIRFIAEIQYPVFIIHYIVLSKLLNLNCVPFQSSVWYSWVQWKVTWKFTFKFLCTCMLHVVPDWVPGYWYQQKQSKLVKLICIHCTNVLFFSHNLFMRMNINWDFKKNAENYFESFNFYE